MVITESPSLSKNVKKLHIEIGSLFTKHDSFLQDKVFEQKNRSRSGALMRPRFSGPPNILSSSQTQSTARTHTDRLYVLVRVQRYTLENLKLFIIVKIIIVREISFVRMNAYIRFHFI